MSPGLWCRLELAGEEFPENMACITCSHVIDGHPIGLVVRDEDGDWQFLCGTFAHAVSDGRIVAISYAIQLEPRLRTLAPVPLGTSFTLEPE